MFDLKNFLREKKKLVAGVLLATLLLAVILTMSRPGAITRQGGSAAGTDSFSLVMPEVGIAPGAIGAPAYKGIGRDMADEGFFPPIPPPTAGQTAAEVDQKIIKNGHLRLVVEKVSEAVTKATELAARKGGFVQSSSVTERGDGTYFGEIVIRVPAKEFEATMTEAKSFATVVKNETSSGQDVTEQYTDLQAQLRNAQAQEETYLQILKRAQTVEDILMVQERLGNIRSVIESLQGRLKYLENVTAYSTVSISLEEEPRVRVPTKEFRLGAIVREAAQKLVAVGQKLIAGLVRVVIVWGGILVPLALLAWLVHKAWLRFRKPKA
jgi:hypothetical protein